MSVEGQYDKRVLCAVGALSETIPLLMKRLDRLQNHSMQMSNISENILRIRELIAEARKAASRVRQASFKISDLIIIDAQTVIAYDYIFSLVIFFSHCFYQVSVSMKFNGNSAVQVRTPSNLADLAAYTSLKFHITLSKETRKKRQAANRQFVFYLGNKNVSPFLSSCVDMSMKACRD